MSIRFFFPLLAASCLYLTHSHAKSPDQVWNLDKLSAAPAVEWISRDAAVQSLTYTAEAYRGQPSRVFAYYASPATLEKRPATAQDKFPGVVLIHGGGGTAFKVWVELWAKRGYAAIAMDLGGVVPNEADPKNRTPLAGGGPDQSHKEKFDTIATQDISDDWPYHAVSNAILAHSLIRSFPEVDAERTAVTGISWGGYTTCLVASVDHRFKAAVPVYGCGFLNDNSTWLKEFEKLGPELTTKWVQMYDPGTWLPQNKAPTFFVNGTNDFAYPLDSYMKSFNVVPVEKNIRIEVKMPHSHESGWAPAEIARFIDQKLGVGNTPALAVIKEVPKKTGTEVSASYTSELPITKAEFNYALPGLPINKREWVVVPATVEDSMVKAPAPPAEADVYFFNITDDKGSMVSSPVYIKGTKK